MGNGGERARNKVEDNFFGKEKKSRKKNLDRRKKINDKNKFKTRTDT